jgi:hypothetical protein
LTQLTGDLAEEFKPDFAEIGRIHFVIERVRKAIISVPLGLVADSSSPVRKPLNPLPKI